MGKPKGGRKKKTELVFDEKSRREFLTGFRKRKQERRKKAKDELEQQVKEERKRIKQDVRDGFHEQFKQSFAPIELEGKLKEEEYETENVTVQIVELSSEEIAKSNNWIGSNKPVYESNGKTVKNSETYDDNENYQDDQDEQEEEEEEEEEEVVPGFTVTSTKKLRKPAKTVKENDANIADAAENETKKKHTNARTDFKSKRAVGQFLAKKTQNTLRQSKAFQTKNKLDKIRNKKKARIEKEKRIKLQNKREKFKKTPSKPTKSKTFSRKNKSQKK